MKRDLNLIRDTLLRIEGISANERLNTSDFPDIDPYELSQHLELMIEADLVIGEVEHSLDSAPDSSFSRLTWSGHEFLDASRDETIWKKVTQRIIKPASSWTLKALLECLKHEAQGAIESSIS